MMLLNRLRKNEGKSLLIAGIVLMWIVIGILFATLGYGETWTLWGVPTHPPVFRDFLLIPGSAESFRHGFEPTIENPYDPGQRIFNYPAFWRLFFYTNISMDDTVWIVLIFLTLYFISLVVFPGKLTKSASMMMLFVIFSPASMLLYERGNADLMVFPICVAIIILSVSSPYWTAGLIAFGSVVKMFPLFGLTVLMKDSRKRFWLLSIVIIVILIVYSLITISSQQAAWTTTMRGDGLSYGSFVFITRLGDYVQSTTRISVDLYYPTAEVLALLFIVVPFISAVRSPFQFSSSDERNLAAFRMGASIYIGTFLLGNNWDYRLAFLVFVIPQLAEWLRDREANSKTFLITFTALLFLTCWDNRLNISIPLIPLKDPVNRAFVFDEIVNWLLLPGMVYLLIASTPDWFKVDFQKIFGSARES